MTIITNIINSAKKTWRGEEDPVKVFYTWGLACYIILPLFTAGLGCLSFNIFPRIFGLDAGKTLSSMLLFYGTPLMFLFIAPLLSYNLCVRNIHNIKIKNSIFYLKKDLLHKCKFIIIFSILIFILMYLDSQLALAIMLFFPITSFCVKFFVSRGRFWHANFFIAILIPLIFLISWFGLKFLKYNFSYQARLAKQISTSIEIAINSGKKVINASDIFNNSDYICAYSEYEDVAIDGKKYFIDNNYIGITLIKRPKHGNPTIEFTPFLPAYILGHELTIGNYGCFDLKGLEIQITDNANKNLNIKYLPKNSILLIKQTNT